MTKRLENLPRRKQLKLKKHNGLSGTILCYDNRKEVIRK